MRAANFSANQVEQPFMCEVELPHEVEQPFMCEVERSFMCEVERPFNLPVANDQIALGWIDGSSPASRVATTLHSSAPTNSIWLMAFIQSMITSTAPSAP